MALLLPTPRYNFGVNWRPLQVGEIHIVLHTEAQDQTGNVGDSMVSGFGLPLYSPLWTHNSLKDIITGVTLVLVVSFDAPGESIGTHLCTLQIGENYGPLRYRSTVYSGFSKSF